MGRIDRRKEEPRKAMEAFKRALAVDPEHEISEFDQGIVPFHDMKDLQGSVRNEELAKENLWQRYPMGNSL